MNGVIVRAPSPCYCLQRCNSRIRIDDNRPNNFQLGIRQRQNSFSLIIWKPLSLMEKCTGHEICVFIFPCNFCPKHVSLLRTFSESRSRCARRNARTSACEVSGIVARFQPKPEYCKNVSRTMNIGFYEYLLLGCQILHADRQTSSNFRFKTRHVVSEQTISIHTGFRSS